MGSCEDVGYVPAHPPSIRVIGSPDPLGVSRKYDSLYFLLVLGDRARMSRLRDSDAR